MTLTPQKPMTETPAVAQAPVESRSEKSPTAGVEPAPTLPARAELSVKAAEVKPLPLNRQVLNTTHAILEYHIDRAAPTGPGKVEVWMTRDNGQTWAKLCEDADAKSPVEFDLPGEGCYGVSIVVGMTPPAAGDSPDYWIEVDTTKPAAKLVSVQAGKGGDSNTVTIAWSASDDHLGNEPVDLYYAPRPEGPWLPIARKVKNDGQYRWSAAPELAAPFFVRVDVTDQAGNCTRCDSTEPVALDFSRARVRVLGVAASVPRPTAPAGN
jgi:hypothetical protein